MQDITILPNRGKKAGESLTPSEQCALTSEFGELIWISRIAKPIALYESSIPARTFEEEENVILNPIDPDEVVGVNLAQPTEHIQYEHV